MIRPMGDAPREDGVVVDARSRFAHARFAQDEAIAVAEEFAEMRRQIFGPRKATGSRSNREPVRCHSSDEDVTKGPGLLHTSRADL